MKCSNSQILSLVYILLPDCKDSKGKETPCELLDQHIYGSTDFLDQPRKCSPKRLIILMYFMCNIYRETSGCALNRCCPALSDMQ